MAGQGSTSLAFQERQSWSRGLQLTESLL